VRLGQLREKLGDRVSVEWKAFLLRSEPRERPMAAFTEYTSSWGRPASMEPGAVFRFPWSGEHRPPSHSIPSAVAAKAVEAVDPERAGDFRRELFDAYFRRNLTISDPEVLGELAAAAGVDTDRFAEALDRRHAEFESQVMADHAEAVSIGVTGVPAVLMADRFIIPGAVETSLYERLVAKFAGGAQGGV